LREAGLEASPSYCVGVEKSVGFLPMRSSRREQPKILTAASLQSVNSRDDASTTTFGIGEISNSFS